MKKYFYIIIIIDLILTFYSCTSLHYANKRYCIATTGIEPFNVVDEVAVPVIGIDSLCSTMKYPEIAYRAGVEGRVLVEFTVNKDGDVVNEKVHLPNAIYILRGIGAGCDELVQTTILNTKFIPAKKKNKPVFSRMRMWFIFKVSCM